ncbi:MAG: hypothetical protein ABI091_28440 [Ferruginibacter sp.]
MKRAKVLLSGTLCISTILLLVFSCKKNVNGPGQSPVILLPDSTAPLQTTPGQTGQYAEAVPISGHAIIERS